MRSGRLGQETLTGNFLSILETLVRNQVEFIVVGGIAAGLRGAPVMTPPHNRPELIQGSADVLLRTAVSVNLYPAKSWFRRKLLGFPAWPYGGPDGRARASHDPLE